MLSTVRFRVVGFVVLALIIAACEAAPEVTPTPGQQLPASPGEEATPTPGQQQPTGGLL
jgi:hypothetical protein